MCFNLDMYTFDPEDNRFVNENREFLRISLLLLYFILFIYLLIFILIYIYIL